MDVPILLLFHLTRSPTFIFIGPFLILQTHQRNRTEGEQNNIVTKIFKAPPH